MRATGPQPTIQLSDNGTVLSVFDLSVRKFFSFAFYGAALTLNSQLELLSGIAWVSGCVSGAGTRIVLLRNGLIAADGQIVTGPGFRYFDVYDWNVNYWHNTNTTLLVRDDFDGDLSEGGAIAINAAGDLFCFVADQHIFFQSLNTVAPETNITIDNATLYATAVNVFNTATLYTLTQATLGSSISYRWYKKQHESLTFEALFDAFHN